MNSKIILVEDNPADAPFAMCTVKRNSSDDEIIYLDDGLSLFAYLGTEQFDLPKLILLDMNMPGMSGLEILRKLKRDESYKSIPVIVLTSSRYERDIVDSYTAGASSYIVKPLDYQKLNEALANLDSLYPPILD